MLGKQVLIFRLLIIKSSKLIIEIRKIYQCLVLYCFQWVNFNPHRFVRSSNTSNGALLLEFKKIPESFLNNLHLFFELTLQLNRLCLTFHVVFIFTIID